MRRALLAGPGALSLVAGAALDASAQLTVRLSAPSSTPAGATVYIAGTFNRWNPADSAYRLARQGSGQYTIVLPQSVRGPVEFKFTLGSWDTVEADSAGADVPNRSFTIPATGAATYTGTVPRWRDGSPRPRPASTRRPGVSILDTAFAMPQLGRTRRVWIYLPPDYATSDKRYPVLYMHDGQNVFDAATSFAGEWGVDEALDSLHALGDRGAIVVAVDNAEQRRPDEYSPWTNPRHGGGEGDEYVEFLAKTLKPYVDRRYRTRPDRLSTGVAGSSMGGLISLYAALKYPDVFGRAGVFSPALWFAADSVFAFARSRPHRPGQRFYFVTGAREGETPEVYVRDQRRMVETLAAAGFAVGAEVDSAVRADGTHSEWFWRREFPAAYLWLFAGPEPTERTSMRRTALASACTAVVACAAPAAAQPNAPAPEWTRGATCYEIFVRSFYDGDGDGVGDIAGLIQKLDYINDGDPATQRDLGARCVWLMPVAASPSYHGYDVTNYYRVNPEYGSNDDFKRLVAEAHRRGIRVLVDMVLNHSSSEHPFFKHASLHPNSPYRGWYLWSPQHPGVRNPWGSDNWHKSPVRDEYYFGLFWSGMPDLNVENPAVVAEMKRIATFWLTEMGVDGFRLDAIKHLVEGGRGAQVENLPGTHVFLRDYAAHVRSVKPDAYTVGEVWDSIGAILPYYPDQLTSHFMFELSDAIFTAVNNGSAQNLFRGWLRLQDTLPPHRYSPFLRNHDQQRTMTGLGGNVEKAKLAATLLLTLPGLPFLYYGEEIGMAADKPDPRLRTPMHWSRGPAAGFTRGMPWEPLQPDSMTANVEAQEGDPNSLLSLHRRLVHLRAAHPALATGRLVPLITGSGAVAAYLRREGERAVLVVANLGAAPATGVALASDPGALPAGRRYATADLLGAGPAAPITVGADGRVQGYVPVPTLGPLQVRVLDLSPAATR
jgi:alpha-amylase